MNEVRHTNYKKVRHDHHSSLIFRPKMRRCVALLVAAALLGVYLCAGGLLRLHEVFSSSSSSSAFSTYPSRTGSSPRRSPPPPQYDRLVVVLIDALRADMVLGSAALYGSAAPPVTGELSAHMSYARGLVASGQALGFLAHASVPTVTMPRLKALVTGKAPAFIDLLKNFNSAALADENLVALLAAGGRRIVFYGDDTWLKLFPSTFARADGTSGFFTRDTVEVDANVTRHLQDELDPRMESPKSKDWDVLVLHYLGLDHVGHLRGPRSPLMVDKLREMDEVVQRVHESVIAQDALRRARDASALPSLILLCSDHGMSEVGNHGGATVEESSALLLFLRGDGLHMGATERKYQQRRMQVDLVPTIASVFGVRIPPYSTGLLIDEVVQASASPPASSKPNSSAHYVQSLYWNFEQLYNLAVIKFHAAALVDFDDTYAATLKSVRRYVSRPDEGIDAESVRALREACAVLQDKLAQSDGSEYNVGAVALGLCFLINSAVAAIYMLHKRGVGSIVDALKDPVEAVLLLGSVLQIVSLTSSSSIENEHATSFYLLTTALCACMLKLVSTSSATDQLKSSQSKHSGTSSHISFGLLALVLLCTRVLRGRNQVINFGRLNGIEVDSQADGNAFANDDSLSILSTSPLFDGAVPTEVFFVLIYGLVVFKSMRLLAKNSIRSQPAASLVLALAIAGFTIGMLCSMLCCRFARDLESGTAQAAEGDARRDQDAGLSVTAMMIKIAGGATADDCARAVYAITTLLVSLLVLASREARLAISEMAVWLLVTLLQRESNLPTLGVLCLQLVGLQQLLELEQRLVRSGHARSLLTLWLAQCAFFALGNSHLVTTIDLSQSFHGLSGYTQWIVGLLTFVSVMSGPLVVFTSLLQQVHDASGATSLLDEDANGSTIAAIDDATAVGLALVVYQTLRFALYTYELVFGRCSCCVAWECADVGFRSFSRAVCAASSCT